MINSLSMNILRFLILLLFYFIQVDIDQEIYLWQLRTGCRKKKPGEMEYLGKL